MKNLEEKQLRQLYLEDEKNPYEIGNILGCEHKTVRKYLRMYKIPLRSASEYNYLSRKSHVTPSDSSLRSPLSLMAHTAYLCEGWHTEKTDSLNFCNTDPFLVDLFLECLDKIYKVKTIRIQIVAKTQEEIDNLKIYYPNASSYTEESRKTPIVRIRAGGFRLAEEFISNAYLLISSRG